MPHFSHTKNSKGFALMEVLIVVGIIIVLSGLITIRAKNALDRAKVKRAMMEIKAMGEAEERVKEDTGYYTRELVELNSPDRPWYFGQSPKAYGLSPWWGPYITSLSLKDPWGNDYIYKAWNPGGTPPGWVKGRKVGWKGKGFPPGKDPDKWAEEDDITYIGDEYSGCFALGSYGSDGAPGGTGSAADIIYGTY